MRIMILAAGRGERMRPLTDTCPKPLLKAAGKPLIVWQIEALLLAGFCEFVINHAWLGKLIEERLGDGSDWFARFPAPRHSRHTLSSPIHIAYSPEDTALETAGGIAKALPLLCAGQQQEVFGVVNGDVFSDFPMQRLQQAKRLLEAGLGDCWSVLVPNPPHHLNGDFSIASGELRQDNLAETFTFSGIGVYHRRLFKDIAVGQSGKLGPILRQASKENRALGELHRGYWEDVGTVERLQSLDARLQGVNAR